MGCPDPELLSAFADGELDVEARRAIERHLAECPACAEIRDELLMLDLLGRASLRAIPVTHTPGLGALSPTPLSTSKPRLLPLAAAFAVTAIAAWLVAPPPRDRLQRDSYLRISENAGARSEQASPPGLTTRRGTARVSEEAFQQWLARQSGSQMPLIPLEDVPKVHARLLRRLTSPAEGP